MNVTVTTDASFYHQHKVGGFAFQIRYSDTLIKKWGPLIGKVSNPTEAELKSVLNALYIVKSKCDQVEVLTINTDCLFIVTSVFNEKKSWSTITKKLAKELRDYLSDINYKELKIKHVRAHTGDLSTNVSYVNDWCDRKSRKGSTIAADKIVV